MRPRAGDIVNRTLFEFFDNEPGIEEQSHVGRIEKCVRYATLVAARRSEGVAIDPGTAPIARVVDGTEGGKQWGLRQ